jgi:hypothetical protein
MPLNLRVAVGRATRGLPYDRCDADSGGTAKDFVLVYLL